VLASALLLATKERLSSVTAMYLRLVMFAIDNPAFVVAMVKKRFRGGGR
jgi:hypothetical protein